jgi:hypothetical protein
MRVRHAKVVAERARGTNGAAELVDHCDHEHPGIRHVSEFLRAEDGWGTACAIFDFVRQIPYRIGFWQVRASQTLELGFGMCTTKSNLQVALLRASGVEAQFAEVLCGARSPGSQIKHYFAIARFGGRWIPMDATFPTVVWRHLHPGHVARAPAKEGGVNPLGAMLQRDAYDFRPMADLAELMQKQPFFDADGVEAMNVVLDRLQGRVLPMPAWAGKIERLLTEDAHAAFLQSYAALTLDAQRLRELIVDRPSRPAAAAGELEHVI